MGATRIEILISQQRIEQRLDELAAAIDGRHGGAEAITCVGVLKGSLYFLSDLTRRLTTPVEIDFVQISSYRGTVRGRLEVKRRPQLDLAGKPVILVEDIIDSGYSVAAAIDILEEHGAVRPEVCTLLDKVPAREIDVPITYRGFEVGDAFVVGYGLDLEERYRNLPYIGVVHEDAAPAPADDA
ncbi:MAG: hypoxanthine phosphoribosyltransferase [Acidobacteriota bacterium]|nr:hypoxanthine phosphoribosyltransferase [Acidobacteriota bacterium]